MSVRCFLDTNVLVYACDSSDAGKQQAALALIAELSARGEGVISTQVLGEFFHATAIRRKLLASEEAERAVLAYQAALIVAAIEPTLVAEAIAVHRRYQTRYWDSLIIATAVRHGCAEIASEDLSNGQCYNGVVVRNPFRAGVGP
ncbi:MAG: PIN domain-containing protein [Chthoniobacteraceae bacterium]